MTMRQFVFIFLLSLYYLIYLLKMLSLKRHGIRGNLLGGDGRLTRETVFQWAILIVTLMGVLVQFISVFSAPSLPGPWLIGFLLASLGVYFFTMSILTMQYNWRAGYHSSQKTNLVTGGIFRISRNPAFLGFDLLYIGCAFAYHSVINILLAIGVVVLFHMQILGEERFLAEKFGHDYIRYWKKVGRYFGRRNG